MSAPIRISIYPIKKAGLPDYTIEGTLVRGGTQESYFYGHSSAEVLTKILAFLLEKRK